MKSALISGGAGVETGGAVTSSSDRFGQSVGVSIVEAFITEKPSHREILEAIADMTPPYAIVREEDDSVFINGQFVGSLRGKSVEVDFGDWDRSCVGDVVGVGYKLGFAEALARRQVPFWILNGDKAIERIEVYADENPDKAHELWIPGMLDRLRYLRDFR